MLRCLTPHACVGFIIKKNKFQMNAPPRGGGESVSARLLTTPFGAAVSRLRRAASRRARRPRSLCPRRGSAPVRASGVAQERRRGKAVQVDSPIRLMTLG